jgi:type II secretory pathway pseudopilin PulG
MKRMLTRKPFSKMEGLTLLETMFAIAIGALVLIAAVVFYMSTKQSANANKSVGDMNAIVAAYESYMTGGNALTAGATGTGTDIPKLQTTGYLPTPLNTAWGQAYTTVVTTSPAAVTITITGAPGNTDNTCKAIAQLAGATGTSPSVTQAGDESTCAFTYPL